MEKLKVTVSTPTSTERDLDVEIPRERFDAIFSERVKKYSKDLKLNGFRRGAIPPRVVAERFREPITNESLEKLAEVVIREVCEENNIKPVGPGKVEELKNNNEGPIQLKAKVEIDLEVEFNDVGNLGISVKTPAPVRDEEIDSQLDIYRQSMAKEEKVDRAGKNGDFVIGEYTSIKIDGELRPLEGKKDFRVEIGADKIKEFNDAFAGCRAGEEKTISVKYPAAYDVKDLAGKQGEYGVKIGEIRQRTLPELNDDLVKRFGYETVQAMKDAMKKNMAEHRESSARAEAEHQVIETIIGRYPFDVPKVRVEAYLEYMEKESGAGSGRVSPEQKAAMEKEAVFGLKRHKIIEYVSKKEKIKPAQQEVDDKIAEIASQNGIDFETLKQQLRQSGRVNDIRQEIKDRKTFDFLLGLS